MKWENSAQLEFAFFSCSTSLSSASMVSTAVASSAEAAVFGLSWGSSEGSTTVAPWLVLHPMSWRNAKVVRELFRRVRRQGKWRRAGHTFKPVSVLWAQVLLLSMATSWLPSKSLHLIVCWFYFTFVCWLFWHNYLLCRLRINWEAQHNMVTDKHREDYVSVTGSHGYQGRTLTLENGLLLSLYFSKK